MSEQKKVNKKHFWIVVLGLLLLISSIVGGTYLLDGQGLISAGTEMQGPPQGGNADMGEMADVDDADQEMRSPPDHEEGGTGFNIQALSSVLEVVLRMGLVVIVVAGGQRIISWLQQQRSRTSAYIG